jgi:hypothetical protein
MAGDSGLIGSVLTIDSFYVILKKAALLKRYAVIIGGEATGLNHPSSAILFRGGDVHV